MKIFVNVGNNKIITLEVERTDLIESIHEKIDEPKYDSEKTFLLAGELVDYKRHPLFIFAGKQLQSERTFEDYNIKDGARLDVAQYSYDSGAGFNTWKVNQERYLNGLKTRFLTYCRSNQIELTPEEKNLSISKDVFNSIPETRELFNFANQNPKSVVTNFLLAEGCIVRNKAFALDKSEDLPEVLPPDVVPNEPISSNLFIDIVTSDVMQIAALILLVAGLAALTAGSFGVAGFIAGFVGSAAIATAAVGGISAGGGLALGLIGFFASKDENLSDSNAINSSKEIFHTK